MLDFADLKRRMDGTVNSLKADLSGLRTGRASANILEPIMVEAYGSKVPMSQVGNISVPEPRLVSVQVWDSALVSSVDKAIRESSLGLNPTIDGALLRIPMPEMTEQRRKEVAKIAHEYAEKARIAARHVRRDALETLKKSEKDGEMGKDDARAESDKVETMTKDIVKEIDTVVGAKEEEIMQV